MIDYYNREQHQNPFFRENLVGSYKVDTSPEIVKEYVRFSMRMCLHDWNSVVWKHNCFNTHIMNTEKNVVISSMFFNVQSKVGKFIMENNVGAEYVNKNVIDYFVSIDDTYEDMVVDMKFQVLHYKMISNCLNDRPIVRSVIPITGAFQIHT